jgi:PAT family beta-lactamase induction signal transducer AmpG
MPAWLGALMTRKMLICIFTGFSSGLPLYLLLNLLPAWLRSEGVDLKTIGFFALIQFPYTWKFLWSPLLDRFNVPGFGRRRGWMLLTQLGLLFTIGFMGGLSPKDNIWPILWLATLLSLLSATQDIAVDAFRREILSDHELGIGNAVHVNAYRIAGLVPGSLSLILADRLPWNEVFWITGAFMLPGMAMAWLVSEPRVKGAPKTLRQAVTEPFHEFIGRQGWRGALMVLGFIFLYKLGDSLSTALATPFYLDMGFTKTDIGLIAKHAGLWPAVFGALLGGLWMVKLGHKSSALALWPGSASHHFWFCLAGRARSFSQHRCGRTYLARCGDRWRSARRRAGHSGFCRVHRPLHPSRLYGNTDGAVHQPGSRTAHVYQCVGGLAGGITRLAEFFLVVLCTGSTRHDPAA